MAKRNAKAPSDRVEALMAEKSAVLSQAEVLATLGMAQTAQPLWASAASFEERIASLLDADGQDLEAAVHRISAASCYEKAGDSSRAPERPLSKEELDRRINEQLPPPPDIPGPDLR